jgi:hypothetical protein
MNSYSQDTKFIIKKHNNYLFEEYYVLTSDNKTKHGQYTMYSASYLSNEGFYLNRRLIQLLETGTYSYGKKEGTWIDYVGNKMSTIHNFKSDSLDGEYYKFWTDSTGPKFNSYFINDQIDTRKDSMIIDETQDSLLVHVHGFFKNDKECSIWSYYNNESGLFFQYDFDKRFLIKDEYSNSENLDVANAPKIEQPIFIEGGIIEFNNDFKTIVSYLPFKNNTTVIIKLFINKEGKINQSEFVNFPLSKNKIEKLKKDIGSLSIKCIPKKIDYKFVDSKVTLEYEINVKNGKASVSGCKVTFEDI